MDLPISFEVLDGLSCQQRGVTRPESHDVHDQWFHSVDLLRTAGSLGPMDVARIERWSQIGSLARTGYLTDHARICCGTSPGSVLFIQDNNTHGLAPQRRISMLPTIYNADAFAYSPDLVANLAEGEQEKLGSAS